MTEQIAVSLGDRSYSVHVGRGLLGHAASLLAPFARRTVHVVTDRNIAALHLKRLTSVLHDGGIEVRSAILDPGEGAKSFQGLERLTDSLLESGLERDGLVLALGGGVIGDLAGFAAGVLKRGIAYAQFPTTLLAQVDSSVGGKTAINTRHGKNLVGLFHQPKIVIADTELLATLPRRELIAGYAEIAKYGALGDPDFFAWLESQEASLSIGEPAALVRAVSHSCRVKAGIVSRDEREAGDRARLNLGHTFGHALEAATLFSDRLLHGEAVAIGMALAFRLSARLGLSSAAATDRLERHLRAMSLPVRISDIPGPRPDSDTLLFHMMHDKKSRDGRPVFVLARGIGQAFVTDDVSIEAVRAVLVG